MGLPTPCTSSPTSIHVDLGNKYGVTACRTSEVRKHAPEVHTWKLTITSYTKFSYIQQPNSHLYTLTGAVTPDCTHLDMWYCVCQRVILLNTAETYCTICKIEITFPFKSSGSSNSPQKSYLLCHWHGYRCPSSDNDYMPRVIDIRTHPTLSHWQFT